MRQRRSAEACGVELGIERDRAMPRGGQIAITLSSDTDGTAVISVRNPGPGIPSESLPRVFDRFFRADAARGGSHKGSGLGLAIVKSIVELQGGSVGVESAVV